MIRVVVSTSILLVAAFAATVQAEDEDRPRPADWKAALAVLRAAESYDEAATGEGGDKSDVYLAYEVLRDGAPAADVRRLLEDDRPVVRAYAVRALAEKHAARTSFYDLALSFLDDHEEVLAFGGCCGADTMVGDLVLEIVYPKLDDREQERLLTRLLATPSPLWFRERALRSDHLTEAWYDRIRPLALEGDGAALVALARFGYAKDLPLVQKALAAPPETLLREPDALMAAHAHASPELFDRLAEIEPGLRKAFKGMNAPRFRHYLGAVAAQDGPRAQALLSRIRDTWAPPGGEHPEDRAELLRQMAAAIELTDLYEFRDLLQALWEEDRIVSPPVVRFFHEEWPLKTRARMETDLAERASEIRPDVLDVELELLHAADPERASDLLVTAIAEHAALRNTAVLSRYAARWKPPEAVEHLLRIVRGEWNPHRYLRAAEALLCYADPDIDERLAACRDENAKLGEGWGGERFSKLMREKPRQWSRD